jgi:hypothetical protein
LLLGDTSSFFLLTAGGVYTFDQGFVLKEVFALHVCELCLYTVVSLLQVLDLILFLEFSDDFLDLLGLGIILLLG